MHEEIELTRGSLTHHSIRQLAVAACAGDGTCGGTCGGYLLDSIADVNLALSSLSRTAALSGVINSTPACAYVAGVLAPALSHSHRRDTP